MPIANFRRNPKLRGDNMSGIKSALTAALSGVTKPSASKAQPLDTESFPCINEDKAVSADQAAQGLEALELNRASLPSNAPTLARSNSDASRNMVDYDLNPHNPRGGREVIPTSLTSASIKSNFLTESLIGSLPKGLSLSEREHIIASTPLSPSLNLLNSLPKDQVSARSAQGKRLRRNVLRGAVIVFITAGYSGKRFIFEKAKELGVRSVLIDGPDSWSRELETQGIVERYIGLDMSDESTVFERVLAEIEGVRRAFGELDGIISFSEMAQPLVARLVEKLGLPGNTAQAQLAEAGAHVGYPAVIKPIHGAASLGVVRVDDQAALERAYARVKREMGSVLVHGGIVEQLDSDDEQQGNFQTTLMMEEDQAVYGAVTDNWPTIEPYFNETGSNSPSILPAQQQKELLELSVASVQALGFDMGVFHVECKYTSRGARLIEVNCRMGGGPVRNMNLMVWGVDLKTGVLTDVSFMEKYNDMPGVLYVRPLVEAGAKVVSVADGMPTWVCEIMVQHPSSTQAAIDHVNEIEQALQKEMPIDERKKN
ncbi:hypothetical protein QBZ16_002462 [Prototheca wickerhamii]|uniref:ATP-grasp domain-containing protein n=1 Tax=Prototheca wickerhamii TaxID=3111 RepID=A0AAD9IM01_PROWI|nr:hypothetical protein QBZ16_002462 [Prototheca wickerhamii]